MRSRTSQRAIGGADLFGHSLEFGGAGDQRREIEAEGLVDQAVPVFSGVAFTVRAVAANDHAAIDEHERWRRRSMTPREAQAAHWTERRSDCLPSAPSSDGS